MYISNVTLAAITQSHVTIYDNYTFAICRKEFPSQTAEYQYLVH